MNEVKEFYKVLLRLDETPMSWIVWAANGKEAMEQTKQELSESFGADSNIEIKVVAKIHE